MASNKRIAWAWSGVMHLAVVLGVCIGIATQSQGQLPSGDNRPAVKADTKGKPVAGVQPVALESLTPSTKVIETIELKPGQLKAFASSDVASWLLLTKSDDATDDGLAMEEAAAGTVVFALDVDKGRWGKFKVPEGGPVILIGCNPDAKGTYLLIKQEVVAGKVKTISQTHIVIAAKKVDPIFADPKPDPTPKPAPVPVPTPSKSRKLATIVIEETEDTMARRSQFFSDADLLAHYKSKGHANPVIVDQNVKDGKTNQPPAKLVPYLNRAKGKTLPQVYLVDVDTGEVVVEGEMTPTMTPKEFLELMRKAGG